MSARINLTPKRALVAAVVALLLLATLGWFGFVAPARATSSGLDRQIASVRADIASPPVPVTPGGAPPTLAELRTAIPDTADTPGLLVQMSAVATAASVSLDSVSPDAVQAVASVTDLPITVVVHGDFFAVGNFIGRLQAQVTVSGTRLVAAGRLIEVEGVDIEQIEPAPQVSATVTLLAFSTNEATAATPDTSVAGTPSP